MEKREPVNQIKISVLLRDIIKTKSYASNDAQCENKLFHFKSGWSLPTDWIEIKIFDDYLYWELMQKLAKKLFALHSL